MTELLTVSEAAKYLGVSSQTIRRRVQSGTLKPARAAHHSTYVAYWFTRKALDACKPVERKRKPQTPKRDESIADVLRGAYRGPSMSDEQIAESYNRWRQARNVRITRSGGVSTQR